jgi:hypothetical protein
MTHDDDEPKRVAQPLDYPSPPLSPYDRPIEPFVTFARRFRLAMRIAGVAAVAIGAVMFLVWRLRR